MRKIKQLAVLAIAIASFGSCQKDISNSETITDETPGHGSPRNDYDEDGDENDKKHVYILSNQVSGNSVLVFDRSNNGKLTYSESVPTGGTGTGGGLGNQGGLIMAGDDNDEDILIAVNAGSNSISSFKIKGGKLKLRSTVQSGGMRPVSLAQYGNLVYVVNAGGINNISGFRLRPNGDLHPIPNSSRPLTAATTGPAQISFVNEGRVLVITEKMTNKIVTYTLNEWGIPMHMQSMTSSSPTPFGFATAGTRNIFVSEAVGGAPGLSVLSSYRIGYNGSITLVKGSVGAGQSAACWVVITKNGRFAYTTNTASDNVTNFNVNPYTGWVSVNTAIAATTGQGPIDAGLSANSRFLYTLNGAGNSITVLRGANAGRLSYVQTVTGVPAGANGLVAR